MDLTLLPLWLPVAYLSVHTGLVLFSPFSPSRKALTLLLNLVLSAGFLALILWSPSLIEGSFPGIQFLSLWSPIIFFWAGYLWAGETLTAVHPPGKTFDKGIIAIEKRLFGQPSLGMAKGRPRWLTELMHFFYATYYSYTPILGIYLYDQKRFNEFEAVSFAVLFGYLVSYTFFALTPVMGPRWSLVEEGLLARSDQRLKGYGLTRVMNHLMYHGLAHKGGAMPSSHSSTAVVFLVWAWRIWGFEGALLAGIVVVGMWTGAIYGRYHFLLDVLIGAAIGLVGVYLADCLILA
ncbi:MAG: phosphatase PAP2 family protein [bacterium]